MSLLLFVVGSVAAVVGLVMIGFGIPINETSIGNTLIVSGVTSLVGGLILFGLGTAVVQLRRIAEALAMRPASRNARPTVETFESQTPANARPVTGSVRIPYPPKPKPESYGREPYPFDPRMAAHSQAEAGHDAWASQAYAPQTRHPEEYPLPIAEVDDVPLSPPQMPTRAPYSVNNSSGADRRHEPAADPLWRQPTAPARPQQTQQATNFDTMWQTETRQTKPASADEPRLSARQEQSQREPVPVPARRNEAEAPPKQRAISDPRAIAILKSGVVDGMGYTLFVDGSIEATLPQGTLRFASINDLRNHLERNT